MAFGLTRNSSSTEEDFNGGVVPPEIESLENASEVVDDWAQPTSTNIFSDSSEFLDDTEFVSSPEAHGSNRFNILTFFKLVMILSLVLVSGWYGYLRFFTKPASVKIATVGTSKLPSGSFAVSDFKLPEVSNEPVINPLTKVVPVETAEILPDDAPKTKINDAKENNEVTVEDPAVEINVSTQTATTEQSEVSSINTSVIVTSTAETNVTADTTTQLQTPTQSADDSVDDIFEYATTNLDDTEDATANTAEDNDISAFISQTSATNNEAPTATELVLSTSTNISEAKFVQLEEAVEQLTSKVETLQQVIQTSSQNELKPIQSKLIDITQQLSKLQQQIQTLSTPTAVSLNTSFLDTKATPEDLKSSELIGTFIIYNNSEPSARLRLYRADNGDIQELVIK